MSKGTVLFNEKCSVCNFEIQHYKKRSSLQYTDCSNMDDKYLKALHVQFEDGKELIGVRAFIYVWNNTNGYKWLGKLIGLPIIFQLSQLLYAVIARLLFWRFKIFN
ncbi:DUF393 domain-containing protein [Pelagibacterales bacterium]|jgi:predicted DCC family thiol-disulfide oxidoreductase YuxK|nr:DUF393 domain-containing protein [Pelagibacterales bacterium]MDA9980779.1 DUF393 domain-containing protein [Pelagibacterales bacterium]